MDLLMLAASYSTVILLLLSCQNWVDFSLYLIKNPEKNSNRANTHAKT